MTFTPNKNIETPAHGADVNTWDVNANANFTLIDECFSGTLLLNATGLSGAQALTQVNVQPPTIQISGAPTAAITYNWPASIGGTWIVQNLTSGGFAVGVQMAGPIGALILIPAGQQIGIWTDGGTNGLQLSNSVYDSNGVHFPDGSVQSTSAAGLTGVVQDYIGTTLPIGWVWANGQTIGNGASGATGRANTDTLNLYSLLWNSWANAQAPVSTGRGVSAAADFAANKTIQLPDFRGNVSVGLDPMGGSGASGRLTIDVNTALPGFLGGNQQQSSMDGPTATTNVDNATGGIFVATSGHTHANYTTVQPVIVMSKIVKL